MSTPVYRICTLLSQILRRVHVGTNLGLFTLMFALLSGRFLRSRGAVFPALADLGLPDDAVRRSEAALCYGQYKTDDLLTNWQRLVQQEGHLRPRVYEGYRPLPCDLIGFFRPRLGGCVGTHFTSQAGKALPAIVFALVGSVGSVGQARLLLPRLLLRRAPQEKESALQQRVLSLLNDRLQKDEAAILDAGFSLKDLINLGVKRFVGRQAKNFTARRSGLAEYPGKGRPSAYGEIVRPLARVHNGKMIPATAADKECWWKVGSRTIRAQVFENLVLSDQKPGSPTFRCVVIHDPRYQEPWVLATNLSISAEAVWRLYRDRWPIEQVPLAAKQMLGAERSFVFGEESRYRLPELALLAGNVLSYAAACSAPVATGFWDRAARPTCGRLRRVLERVTFSELPLPGGQLRKKEAVTAHLCKGIDAHRRHKTPEEAPEPLKITLNPATLIAFTGN